MEQLLQVLAADTADLKLVAADDGGAAEVLLLPGRAFRQLCRRHPPLLARCAALLLPRVSPLVRLLDHASEWMQLRGGEALARARGAVYVVLCGRLLESAAVTADGAAERRGGAGRSVGVGGSIGEGELLAPPSDAAAAAGAVATRDSQLVMLPGALLTGAAAAVEPAAHAAQLPLALGRQLARQLSEQATLRAAPRLPRGPRPSHTRLVCLLPLSGSAALQEALTRIDVQEEDPQAEHEENDDVEREVQLVPWVTQVAAQPLAEGAVVVGAELLGLSATTHRVVKASEWHASFAGDDGLEVVHGS